MAAEYVFQVRGMTCPLCVMAVERALRRIKGVSAVEADLGSGRVVVKAAQPLEIDELSKAIRQSGRPLHKFEASLLTQTAPKS